MVTNSPLEPKREQKPLETISMLDNGIMVERHIIEIEVPSMHEKVVFTITRRSQVDKARHKIIRDNSARRERFRIRKV